MANENLLWLLVLLFPVLAVLVIMLVLKGILHCTAKKYDEIISGPEQGFYTMKLKILDYNVFWRPDMLHLGVKEYMRQRSELLLERIRDYDIVCLEEGFQFGSNIAKNFIDAARAMGFKFILTSELPPFFTRQVIDSGLILLSRYPIIESDRIRYTTGCGFDFFSAKGALYAKIQLDENNHVHVFSTHLQASYSAADNIPTKDVKIRQSQFDQLSSFMAKKATDRFPVIVCGDLNVNSRCGTEYNQLIEHFKIPDYDCCDTLLIQFGEHPVTHGGMILVDGPIPEENLQSLDYIYLFTHKNSPIQAKFKSNVDEMICKEKHFTRLSDHYAVESEFNFSE